MREGTETIAELVCKKGAKALNTSKTVIRQNVPTAKYPRQNVPR